MCGIAGLVHFDGRPIDRGQLEAMGTAIAHRGWDGSGVHIDGSVGLLHRRLAIIDLSPSGVQPQVSDDGDFAIVFNGEIVNYLELRRELEAAGAAFSGRSDTEVLLTTYRIMGIKGLPRLRGFFAFAILDRPRRRLVLGRDIFGIKPLHVMRRDRTLAFSSEVKSFVKSGLCEAKVDAHGLQDYLFMQMYLPGRTLFAGVSSLLPGHVLEIDLTTGRETTCPFWEEPCEETRLSYENWLEELDYRLVRAVHNWVRADVPVGAYISGGLDSSLVATVAAQQLDSPLQNRLLTFSSVFSSTRTPDERQWSDAVARDLGSEHQRIEMSLDEIVKDHEDQIYVLDMPIAGYSAPYRTLSRHVRRSTKVVLTGHGGDEMAAGYPKYIALALAEQINTAYQTGSDIDLGPALPFLRGFEDQARNIVAASLFRDEEALLTSVFDRSGFLWSEVRPELRVECGEYRTVNAVARLASRYSGGPLRRALKLDAALLLPALLHVEDRTAMIENLESRPPLLDQDIAEWLSIAPAGFLLKNGLKSPLRDLGRRYLPRSVAENPRKSGVVFPVFDLVHTRLRDLVAADLDVLDRSGLFIRPARELLRGAAELSNMRILWALWSLGSWIRAFNPAI
jgi:asparagine synthase (glutamine-hydrolysing)